MADDIWNPGKDIIDAFMKGAALQQQRLESVRRTAAQITQAKLAEERIKNNMQQFQERMTENQRIHDSQIKLRDTQEKLNNQRHQQVMLLMKIAAGKAINQGLIEPDADGNYAPTAKGTEWLAAAERGEMIERAKNIPKYELFNKEQLQRTIDRSMLQNQAAQNAYQAQERRLAVQEEQGDLNRANRLAYGALIGGRQQQAREAKERTIEEEAIALTPSVMKWEDPASLKQITSSERNMAIRTKFLNQGLKLPGDKEIAYVKEGAKLIQNFHSNIKQIKDLVSYATQNVVKDFKGAKEAAGRAIQIRDTLQPQLENIARFKENVKGVLTDKDIDRINKAVPAFLPGGPLGFILAGNEVENKARVDDVEKVYFEKLDQIFGPDMKPEQRKEIETRYNLWTRAPGTGAKKTPPVGPKGVNLSDPRIRVKR